ncbi:S8 family peptidase [Acidovorax sp. ACV02]|uniref:S8 family peptidase n=1 Tax=Acidovorax sp. ACV02 TaxID=2769310 RepID=UPI00177A853E|nr:S8 family peptidase [Acidovorax sp. ACV02]MBD9405623.1 S8 family peptidase [Acidovorax sp. ACV02]
MPTETRPVLNPVLSFKREPRLVSVTGRSAEESQVVVQRLEAQKIKLSEQISGLENQTQRPHAGKLLVAVRMFDDSLAPSYEPESIFRETLGSELVAPIEGGYLAQLDRRALGNLSKIVRAAATTDVRVTVSRIKEIKAQTESDVLRGRTVQSLWERAIHEGRGRVFTLWLAPYKENMARSEVSAQIGEFAGAQDIYPLADLVAITREQGSDADQLQVQSGQTSGSIIRAIREYRQNPFTRMQFVARDPSALTKLIGSGAVFRIEPVKALKAADVPSAPDPERPVPDEQWQPIVGVVDGGMFAQTYSPMVAWRAPSLVSDIAANRKHGNRVGSLVVHGAAWNTHLALPSLVCRIGVAQAIAKDEAGSATRTAFRSYLHAVIARHHGDTKVWNFSFNEPVDGADSLEMSELGHEIHKIAREFDILPVISIGNVDQYNDRRLNPPGDCEAALTVGGRIHHESLPGAACDACLPGPGPEGLTKPEISWFSTLRGLGGNLETGTSYATAIVSAVAAHTFHQLKAPTPDLVKALLINTADGSAYDNRLGWGSPCLKSPTPWECPEGSVTLIWNSSLRAGLWHYWEDIPIPPEFITENKLKGSVALTAILRPKVSELGSANYFSTRLQVALQYTKPDGKMGNLAGSMKESTDPEAQARAEHAKWNPIRHHATTIPGGRAFSGRTLRVCARVFGRDLYQFGISGNAELEESRVAFALTLSAPPGRGSASIYNSVATSLGNYVESAVNDIEVDVPSS